MMHRALAPLLLAAGAGLAAPAAQAACTDCNVLWVVIDTTRADHVGAYGDTRGLTPNIDAVARRGTVYEQAWTQGPDTMVSVSSYFTGRYNRSTGMDFTIFNRDQAFHPLSPQLTTVAEVLQGKGWKTRGMTANMVIAEGVQWDLAMHQGFETWQSGTDEEVARWGAQQLEELKDDRFLLYLHLMGPHHPNERLPGFAERRGGDFPATLDAAENHIYGAVNKGDRTLTEQEAAYLQALYADALWQADSQLGPVFAKLEALGLDDETLVIITSDHGEALGDVHNDQPVWGHGHALKEPLLHVPLVIAGPGVKAGHREQEQMAELVDLAPTITGWLGIPRDDAWGWDGAPLFGPGAERGTTSIADRGIPGKSNSSIRTINHVVTWWEPAKRWFYYDLSRGPQAEQSWLAQATPEHQRLQAVLQGYLDSARAPEDGGQAAMSAPEGDTLQALRELGYVE